MKYVFDEVDLILDDLHSMLTQMSVETFTPFDVIKTPEIIELNNREAIKLARMPE